MIYKVETEKESNFIPNAQDASIAWLLSFTYSLLKMKTPSDPHEIRKGQPILDLLKDGKVKLSFQEKDGQIEYITWSNNPLTNILDSARIEFMENRKRVIDRLNKLNECSFEQKKYIANMIELEK